MEAFEVAQHVTPLLAAALTHAADSFGDEVGTSMAGSGVRILNLLRKWRRQDKTVNANLGDLLVRPDSEEARASTADALAQFFAQEPRLLQEVIQSLRPDQTVTIVDRSGGVDISGGTVKGPVAGRDVYLSEDGKGDKPPQAKR